MSRPLAKSLLFTGALIALFLFVVEAASQAMFRVRHGQSPRAFAAGHLYRYEHRYRTDHPYLPYIARKGAYDILRFNSLGDRGPEPESPKRRIRLVCYGGSTTFDAAHSDEETWPGMLQAMLGTGRHEVINAAQNGATSADTLVNFALLHADLRPDFLLVLDGINDLESSYQTGFRSDYSHRRRKIPDFPFPFLDSLPRWLDRSALWVQFRFSLTGDQRDLHELYTIHGEFDFERGPFGLEAFRRNLLSLDALAAAHGAKLVLGTPPFYRAKADKLQWALEAPGIPFGAPWQKGIDAENRVIRELARTRKNVRLAEVAGSFIPSERTMTDFCHLNADGNRKVAEAFYAALKRAGI